MTPAEQKARELYKIFYDLVHPVHRHDNVKRIGVLCVNECIKSCLYDFVSPDNPNEASRAFWEDVRTAIEQMP